MELLDGIVFVMGPHFVSIVEAAEGSGTGPVHCNNMQTAFAVLYICIYMHGCKRCSQLCKYFLFIQHVCWACQQKQKHQEHSGLYGPWLCAAKCPRSDFKDFCSMQRTNPGGTWGQTAVHPAIDWATWLLSLWWAAWTDNQPSSVSWGSVCQKATFVLQLSSSLPIHLWFTCVLWFILLWRKAQRPYWGVMHHVNPSEPDSISAACLCPVCAQALWQTFPWTFSYTSISIPIFLPSDTICLDAE